MANLTNGKLLLRLNDGACKLQCTFLIHRYPFWVYNLHCLIIIEQLDYRWGLN